ncbi:MAG: TIGR00282 family metallophosphoesterase [Alphaproteobacteria bacterium]|nr:TIGR00282 family metallophosphoesterase [Alphaproteobacteria bacterium]
MRFFYAGDIVARSGREIVSEKLTYIKEKYKTDAIILNVENAAHGFGVTPGICRDFLAQGADILLTGNHFLNQRDIVPFLDECKTIVRPANIPDGNPGRGFVLYELPDGRKILVIQLLGRLYMEAVDCPVQTVDAILKNYTLGRNVDAIMVDIHAEATSEKQALGYYLDGRVSCVAGTHTHVPTADARLLPKGTAYITDVGMCGDYNSVLGFDVQAPINRLRRAYVGDRLTPAKGKASLFGIFVETDDSSGLAKKIEQIKISPSE